MTTPRISSYYMHWLYDYVRERGIQPELALGPLRGRHEQPFYVMTEWAQQLDRVAHLLRDPDLGLNFGRTFTPQRFGVLGYLFHHCDDLGQVYARMTQYQRLLLHLRDSRMQRLGDLYALVWHLEVVRPSWHEEMFTVASALQFARTLTGNAIALHSVGLISPPPADTRVLDEFLGCPVQYNQSMTYMASETSLLAVRNLHSDSGLRRVLEEQADVLLAALPPQDDLVLGLRHRIVSLLQEGEPTLDRVAQAMQLSARTLHRRLAERGYRFRDLLEATRREMAEAYLRDEQLSLAEVALLLGYSEQSPFSHAFKRWTGMTPLDWRKQQRSGAGVLAVSVS